MTLPAAHGRQSQDKTKNYSGYEVMLHVDIPTRSQIDRLAGYRGGPAVSIYLRTTPLTQNTKDDRIELKNLIKAAVAELEEAETPKRSIWPIQESVDALIEDDGKVTFDAHVDAVNYGVNDEIARRVLQSGGRVVSARQADVPGGGELAALLRYSV